MLLIFLGTSCADTWGNVKRGLTGSKQQTTDEFLVKKRIHLFYLQISITCLHPLTGKKRWKKCQVLKKV